MAGLIVAGVDGSAPALAAVEWAAEDAARGGAALKTVVGTLKSESERAGTIAVGSRGVGGFAGLVLGSVGLGLAGLRGVRLRAIHAWQMPVFSACILGYGPVLEGLFEDEARTARRCWARSATVCCTARTARSPSSGPAGRSDEHRARAARLRREGSRSRPGRASHRLEFPAPGEIRIRVRRTSEGIRIRAGFPYFHWEKSMSEHTTAPGDLGRRVGARRGDLGLSREQLAERAGIDTGYLAYLEETAASPTSETVQSLAAALETTPEELLGGTVELPPGRGSAADKPSLERLDPNECLHLIFPGGVGRVAFDDGGGPAILPVNYLLHDNAVVFRTAAGGPFDENLRTGVEGVEFKVAFEVDRIDDPGREGWSVLIRGGAHLVTSAEEQAVVQAAGVQSWVGGERDLYVKIIPAEVSGRRIRHHP